MGTQQQVYEKLTSVAKFVPEKDLDFVWSLLNQKKSGKVWSEKQAYWANKLAEQYDPQTKLDLQEDYKTSTRSKAKDLTELNNWFDNAGKKLKYPTISLSINGFDFQIKRTKTGKYPGSFTLTEKKEDAFLGWVKVNGEVIPYGKNEDMSDILIDTMNSLADDPLTFVKEYGRKTGCCCFCGSKLENEGSTEVGYGPHCAKVWNLPWASSVQALKNKGVVA